MPSSVHVELRYGFFSSASLTIWTKNGTYDSAKPYRWLNSSLLASRYACSFVTSTSRSDHACGDVLTLRTMCSAIWRRTAEMRTTSSPRSEGARMGDALGGEGGCCAGAAAR